MPKYSPPLIFLKMSFNAFLLLKTFKLAIFSTESYQMAKKIGWFSLILAFSLYTMCPLNKIKEIRHQITSYNYVQMWPKLLSRKIFEKLAKFPFLPQKLPFTVFTAKKLHLPFSKVNPPVFRWIPLLWEPLLHLWTMIDVGS